MRKIVTLTLLTIVSVSFAIEYTDRSDIYFGRQNSARSEAMGRGMVAVFDGIYSTTQNPALITGIDGIEAVYSHSSPLYLFISGKYDNFGIGYNYANLIYAAFSVHQFSEKDEYVPTDNYGLEMMKITGSTQRDYDISLAGKYALTSATELSVGINFNILRDENHGENHSVYHDRTSADLGINWVSQTTDFAKFNLAASLSNITKTVYEKIDDIDISDRELPQIAKIGASAEFDINSKDFYYSKLLFLKSIFTWQYQDVLNDKTRDGFSVGSEFQLLEIVNLRAGYYKERIDESNNSSNREWFKEFTYGFGLNLPVAKITNYKIPLNVGFDFTKLPQPSYMKNDYKWDDFTSFAFRLNYLL